MSEHTILHKEADGRGMFYIAGQRPGQDFRAAMMYHRWGEKGNKVNVDHTEVSEPLRGQDVGLSLLRELSEWARKEELGVSATCPFVVKMFERHKADFKDVIVEYTEEPRA